MNLKAEAGENDNGGEAAVLDDEKQPVEIEVSEDESADGQQAVGSDDEHAEESDEVVVSIGEESPPTEEEVRAPEWVRELRKANRERASNS